MHLEKDRGLRSFSVETVTRRPSQDILVLPMHMESNVIKPFAPRFLLLKGASLLATLSSLDTLQKGEAYQANLGGESRWVSIHQSPSFPQAILARCWRSEKMTPPPFCERRS